MSLSSQFLSQRRPSDRPGGRSPGIRSSFLRVAALGVVLTLVGCTQPTSTSRSVDDGAAPPVAEPAVLPDWGDSHYQVIDAVAGTEVVTIPASMAGRYLFLVMTNGGSEGQVVPLPSLEGATVSGNGASSGGALPGATAAELAAPPAEPRAVRGRPGQFDHPPLIRDGAAGDAGGAVPREITPSTTTALSSWALGDPEPIRTEDGTITAAVDAVRRQGEWSLYVWKDVAAGTPAVTGEMSAAVADAFLDPAADDIFDIMTGVFGVPWGDHDVFNVIAPERRDIHVLLYDIEGDGVPIPGESRTVGYFWSGDSFRRSSYLESNERLMFYLDSALLADTANKDGTDDGLWSRDDYWPEEAIATLAHEFQHMVQFYQRPVERGDAAVYATWLDELMAMAAEETVARAIAVDGPRGVPWSEGGAGTAGNQSGRMPRYNDIASRTPLTTWDAADPLDDYAVSYSFGAFLIRVFGVQVLSELMEYGGTPSRSDYSLAAVAAAASAVDGTGISSDELLQRWGVAVLVSDDTATPDDVRINTGTWIGDSGSNSVSVGSLNAYNYRTTDRTFLRTRAFDGPRMVPAGIGSARVAGTSNLFVAVGTVPAAGGELAFALPAGVVATAIVR